MDAIDRRMDEMARKRSRERALKLEQWRQRMRRRRKSCYGVTQSPDWRALQLGRLEDDK